MVAESNFDWSSLKMAAGQASYASAVGMHPPKRRRPTQRRDTETADGKFLLLYVICIMTSLFFVTKFALGL